MLCQAAQVLAVLDDNDHHVHLNVYLLHADLYLWYTHLHPLQLQHQFLWLIYNVFKVNCEQYRGSYSKLHCFHSDPDSSL
jgi:hypothetical protein